MPSTVASLFAAAGLSRSGVVAWASRIPPPKHQPGTGVYIAALTRDANSTEAALAICPLASEALEQLLDARPELILDGKRPDVSTLGMRLGGFWCADEVVVYIGLAGPRRNVTVSELSDRVQEYYTTPLGARSPHSGGWPLKTLSNLGALYVHYAYCDGVEKKEQVMLKAFAGNLSAETQAALYDATRIMPFANLKDGTGALKLHGIKGARAPRSISTAPSSRDGIVRRPSDTPAARQRPTAAAAGPATAVVYYTQRITAADIKAGIIRVPGPTKALFPHQRANVDVELRGKRRSCLWDPRYGPDMQRSGVIRIGRALMRMLSPESEPLRVRAEGDVFYLG